MLETIAVMSAGVGATLLFISGAMFLQLPMASELRRIRSRRAALSGMLGMAAFAWSTGVVTVLTLVR